MSNRLLKDCSVLKFRISNKYTWLNVPVKIVNVRNILHSNNFEGFTGFVKSKNSSKGLA